MRDLFAGYYQLKSEEFDALWRDGFIVLDANVLLNLHRYPETAREELLRILAAVSDRLWIPHQAALEYHKNRAGIVSSQAGACSAILNGIDKVQATIESEFGWLRKRYTIDLDDLLVSLSDALNGGRKWVHAQEPKVPGTEVHEELADRIAVLLDGKVGPEYSLADLDRIYETARERFQHKVPPGYMDNAKKSNPEKYNDVVVWFQILDFAKQEGRGLILVSDDAKEDWFLAEHGKTIGPRPELATEFFQETKANFYAYSTETFMTRAYDYLKESVVREAIEGIRETYEVPLATDAVLVDRWERRALADAIKSLSSPERDVILLRMVENMSISDIAQSLGISNNYVKRLQRSGLHKIKDLLDNAAHG